MIQKRERRRADGSTYAVWRVRWEDAGRERSRTFDRLKDARAFEAKVRTRERLWPARPRADQTNMSEGDVQAGSLACQSLQQR